MVSSGQTTFWSFLDGGLRESRGFFEPDCGMFVEGSLAKQYILYRLGENAATLLGSGVQPYAVLSARVKRDKKAHAQGSGPSDLIQA